jgi:hypothetical protein
MHTRTHPRTHFFSILTLFVSGRGYERANACHLQKKRKYSRVQAAQACVWRAYWYIFTVYIFVIIYIIYIHHARCCMFVRWCCIHANVYTYTGDARYWRVYRYTLRCCTFARWCCIHVNTREAKQRWCCTTWALKKKNRRGKRQWCCGTSALGRERSTGSSLRPSCGVCRFFPFTPLPSSIPFCPWAKSVGGGYMSKGLFVRRRIHV